MGYGEDSASFLPRESAPTAVNRKAVRWVSMEESRPSVTRFWRDSLPCAGVLYRRCSLTGRGARGRGSSPAVRPLLGGLRDRPRAACGPRALGRSSKASRRPGEGVRPGAGTPEGLRPRPCPAGTVLEPSIPPVWVLTPPGARPWSQGQHHPPPPFLPHGAVRGLWRLRGHQGLRREMPWGIGPLGQAPWVSTLFPLPSGATCEVVLAPCAPGPCRNGGECRESEDFESFSCVCPAGWQGAASWPCSPAWVRSPGAGGLGGSPSLQAAEPPVGALEAEMGLAGPFPSPVSVCLAPNWEIASRRAPFLPGVSPGDGPGAEKAAGEAWRAGAELPAPSSSPRTDVRGRHQRVC